VKLISRGAKVWVYVYVNVYVCMSHFKYRTTWPIVMKLDINILALEDTAWCSFQFPVISNKNMAVARTCET
jgi:hypothetical protein